MNPSDSQDLLAEYVRNGSESAFRELVNRYLELVYSTALRCVDGDRHGAEDVAQMVFLDLSRFASRLSKDVMIGGWLHRHTCYVASTYLRGERRRRARERVAMEMSHINESGSSTMTQLAPILDAAINELPDEDRKAILLRFYERLDLRAVGQALGSSENAAQKRVSRALDQLHLILARQGVTISVAGLSAILAAEAVAAAPSGLATSIVSTAVAGAVAGTGITVTLFKISTLTKLKIGIASALVAGALTAPIWLEHQSQLRLAAENESLRHQLADSVSAPSPTETPAFGGRKLDNARTERGAYRARDSAPDLLKVSDTEPSRSTAAIMPNSSPVAAVPVLYTANSPRTRFYAVSGSNIKIEGKSNIHDWQAESSLISGFLEVGPEFPVEPGRSAKPGLVEGNAEIFVMTRSLKSIDQKGKPFSDRMDEVLHQALKANDYPKIKYRLTELKLSQPAGNKQSPNQFETQGELVIAGVTNDIALAVDILPIQDRKLKISGSTTIKMTDFDLQTTNLGPEFFRAQDEVKLTFTWMVSQRKQSSDSSGSGK